jgi:hypothetical protein
MGRSEGRARSCREANKLGIKISHHGVGTEKEAIPLNGVVEGFKKRQQ